MDATIEILVGDVNDVEAHVFAQYIGSDARAASAAECESIVVQGMLRGPFCERAHTLPAQFTFHQLGFGRAEAVVPDPCTWSPELPHLYQVDVQVRRDGEMVAEYHGKIGLRRATKKNG